MKGFALKVVLKQRHMRTRKWPISMANMRRKQGRHACALRFSRVPPGTTPVSFYTKEFFGTVPRLPVPRLPPGGSLGTPKILGTGATLHQGLTRLHVENWECCALKSSARGRKFDVPCRFFRVSKWGLRVSSCVALFSQIKRLRGLQLHTTDRSMVMQDLCRKIIFPACCLKLRRFLICLFNYFVLEGGGEGV